MLTLLNRTFTLALLATILFASIPALAAPIEPTPYTTADGYRALRSDFVKPWYIYADTNNNGILDPGDRKVATIQNWWTPASSGTQYNYTGGPTEPYGGNQYNLDPTYRAAGPMNFATNSLPSTDPRKSQSSTNYWLPTQPQGTLGFYMTYSQRDNNNWATFNPGGDATYNQIARERNQARNGWAMGWIANGVKVDANGHYTFGSTPLGTVNMDISVHNGEGTFNVPGFGTSISSPQLSLSNNINNTAFEPNNGQWQPPNFDQTTKTYSWVANSQRMNYFYPANTTAQNQAAFTTMVNSMDYKQVNPLTLTGALVPGKTPAQLLANGVLDSSGNPYQYQDSFQARATYSEGTTVGGVIAGLAGQSSYDHTLNNWGDQQVIRIDLDPASIADGSVKNIAFYDFGTAGNFGMSGPNVPQVNPTQIILNLADTSLFPDNRFYIAQVDNLPEPATMALLAAGSIAMLIRRKRKA